MTDTALQQRYAAAIRPAMLIGLQDAELYDEPGAERINEWVDWIARTLASVHEVDTDEPSLIPPSEQRAHLLGEISVPIETRLRALGYADAADEIVGILRDIAREADIDRT